MIATNRDRVDETRRNARNIISNVRVSSRKLRVKEVMSVSDLRATYISLSYKIIHHSLWFFFFFSIKTTIKRQRYLFRDRKIRGWRIAFPLRFSFVLLLSLSLFLSHTLSLFHSLSLALSLSLFLFRFLLYYLLCFFFVLFLITFFFFFFSILLFVSC